MTWVKQMVEGPVPLIESVASLSLCRQNSKVSQMVFHSSDAYWLGSMIDTPNDPCKDYVQQSDDIASAPSLLLPLFKETLQESL